MTTNTPHPRTRADRGARIEWTITPSGRELRDADGRTLASLDTDAGSYRRGIPRDGFLLGVALAEWDGGPIHVRACAAARAGAGVEPLRASLARLGYLLDIEPGPTGERVTIRRAPLVMTGQGAYTREYDPTPTPKGD